MIRNSLWLAGVALVALGLQAARADEVRYFEKDGITYRETRQTVQRPITHTQYEPRQTTSYRENYTTALQEVPRTYQVPVSEYQWEQRWDRGWNPFNPPTLTYRLVPRTRWESRTDTVRVPVTRRELIPQTLSTQVPVVSQRYAQEEVISRVAVGTNNNAGAAVASTNQGNNSGGSASSNDPFARPTDDASSVVGGVSKLNSDPPRQGSGWRAGDPTVRR